MKTLILKKKGNLSNEKNIMAIFLRSIEQEKCWASINRGAGGLSTNIVEDMVLLL